MIVRYYFFGTQTSDEGKYYYYQIKLKSKTRYQTPRIAHIQIKKEYLNLGVGFLSQIRNRMKTTLTLIKAYKLFSTTMKRKAITIIFRVDR